MYYALIGDMVASKKLSPEERWTAQERLASALEKINREFADTVAADFLITLGDEFQGLMKREADPVSAALMIMHELRPYEIRIAIGLGGISTRIDRSAALGADALLTGEIKHNQIISANHCGIAVIDAGHFRTENIVIAPLCEKLGREFSDVEFIRSTSCTDGVEYI